MICHPTSHPEQAGDGSAPASPATHRWSSWQPCSGNLLERRCVSCGTLERGTYDAVNGAELDRLEMMLAAARRAFR
jgi:hypothetical protein